MTEDAQPAVTAEVNMLGTADALVSGGVTEEPPEADDTRSARQRILDHFEDTEGDQTVAQILEGTALSRAVVDPLLSRMTAKGVLLRVATGLYRFAPPQPEPEPIPVPSEQPRADGVEPRQWNEWLWAWQRSGYRRWEGPGEAPHPVDGVMAPGCVVGLMDWMIFQGERDALEKQQAEDDALRDRLILAAYGNVMRTSRLNDLSAVKVMLAGGIPLETIEQVIRNKHDPRINPKNLPLTSFVDLLRPVAEWHARFALAPKLVERWNERLADSNATTEASPTLRRAMSEIALQEAAGEPDALAAGVEPPTSADAPSTIPDDVPAAPGVAPAADPMANARSMLLSRFRRAASPAEPAAPAVPVEPSSRSAPPPSRSLPDARDDIAASFRARRTETSVPVTAEPSSRPWFAPTPQQPGPDHAWLDEMTEAYRNGALRWPSSTYGPPPGSPKCRVPPDILRRHGFIVED